MARTLKVMGKRGRQPVDDRLLAALADRYRGDDRLGARAAEDGFVLGGVRYDDVADLREFLGRGRYACGQVVQHRALVFVQSEVGGDEWIVLRVGGRSGLEPFGLVAFGPAIERGNFTTLVARLAAAGARG